MTEKNRELPEKIREMPEKIRNKFDADSIHQIDIVSDRITTRIQSNHHQVRENLFARGFVSLPTFKS